MGRSRWTTAVLGLTGSLALSAALWTVFGTPAVFLFVPFVPFVLGRRSGSTEGATYRCPRCDFRTSDADFRYCPRDGRTLRRACQR